MPSAGPALIARLARAALLATALAALPAAASAQGAAPAAAAGTPAVTRISYLTGASAYLDAGRDDGLLEGDTLTVERDGRAIARLRVTFLSTRRSACDTLSVAEALRVGDTVRFLARAPAAPAVAAADSAAATAAAPAAPRPRRAVPLHGRVGARMLTVNNEGATSGRLSQPSFDFRLDGTDVGGSSLDLSVDARTRRTTRTLPDGTLESDASTRVYRASASLHDPSGKRRMTLGRQTSPTIASVSIFDGALAELAVSRVTVGAFSGTQPDPVHDGFSGTVFQHGAFLAMRQRPNAPRRWTLAAGGVTSRSHGEINRDFLFAQGDWTSGRTSASIAQEFDVYRGWRRGAGDPGFSPTSTFAMARIQVHPAVSVRTGYDNRRSVRLYRDRETPETQFDDRYREGGWLGANVDLGRHARIDGDARVRAGSAAERSHSWSAGGELTRLPLFSSTLRARWSQFTSDPTESRLLSGSLGLDPLPTVHLELAVGDRATTDRVGGGRESVRWWGTDLDLSLARRWYASGSFERDRGGSEDLTQANAGLSWRF